MTCCGCGQETTMCVACPAAWNCATPVCAECAQKALDQAAAVERALWDVRVRDRLWKVTAFVRSLWAANSGGKEEQKQNRLSIRIRNWIFGRPGRSSRRETDRRRNPSEVA